MQPRWPSTSFATFFRHPCKHYSILREDFYPQIFGLEEEYRNLARHCLCMVEKLFAHFNYKSLVYDILKLFPLSVLNRFLPRHRFVFLCLLNSLHFPVFCPLLCQTRTFHCFHSIQCFWPNPLLCSHHCACQPVNNCNFDIYSTTILQPKG